MYEHLKLIARVACAFVVAATVLGARQAQAQAPLSAELAAIERQANARGAILGNPQGGTVLFEFFDYNCPHCRAGYPFLLQMTRDYPDLKVVLVEFPILSENSRNAARHALQLSGPSYPAVYSAIMTRGGRADGARIVSEAQTAGATVIARDLANTDPAISAELASNAAVARGLGMNAVPGFYINGRVTVGLNRAAVVRAVCGYSGRGTCNSYVVLIEDAKQEQLGGTQANVRRFLTMAVADARRVNGPSGNNSVCWEGAMLNQAAIVLPACEAAVEAAPNNASYRDSRGVARALTGDRAGAIADFQFYLDRAAAQSTANSPVAQSRREAVARLSSPEPLRNDDLIVLLRN